MNKTVLCIIDGLGIRVADSANAVAAADMKNLNSAMQTGLYKEIKASGTEVGLADEKDAGNSEVGHNAIGSGQYIKQGLALLNYAFETKEIYNSDCFAKLVQNAKKSKLNIITLLSDGRLHSDMYKHLFPLIEKCAQEKIKLSIHALVDGRDTPTQSAMKYINDTRAHIAKCKCDAKIVTVAGRGVLFMDRYELNTKLLSDAIDVCVFGKAQVTKDIEKSISDEYKARPTMTDETMPAFILEPDALIKNGDSVLLLNYRGDRAIETCEMFEKGKYLSPTQYKAIDKCFFAGVLQYDAELLIPKNFLCNPPKITNTLTEWLVKNKVRQYSVTETVKYGHLTYFFNGNRALPFDPKLETWKEFKSDICGNMYNSAPRMKAELITDDAIAAIKSGKYDFIKLNLPNPDMVGHTADFDAVVNACKCVDECLGKLISACKADNVNLVICADHGNAETMRYPDGKPYSAHTNTPVPFIVISPNKKFRLSNGTFGLTNIASTICLLLDVPADKAFNPSIIEEIKRHA